MPVPGIFEPTIFSPPMTTQSAKFIQPMHPKTEIKASREIFRKLLDSGWVGQHKIHGHRGQFHISADPDEPIVVFTRHGTLHKRDVSPGMARELRRLFQPDSGWNAIDAEWVKPTGKVFVFDLIKRNGDVLYSRNFKERYEMLPRVYQSEIVSTLPLFYTVEKCMEAYESSAEDIEGLVFKATQTPGFSDTSIIRCRKR